MKPSKEEMIKIKEKNIRENKEILENLNERVIGAERKAILSFFGGSLAALGSLISISATSSYPGFMYVTGVLVGTQVVALAVIAKEHKLKSDCEAGIERYNTSNGRLQDEIDKLTDQLVIETKQKEKVTTNDYKNLKKDLTEFANPIEIPEKIKTLSKKKTY